MKNKGKENYQAVCRVCGKKFERQPQAKSGMCDPCGERIREAVKVWKEEKYPQRDTCIVCGKPIPPKPKGTEWLRKGSCGPACQAILATAWRQCKDRQWETKKKTVPAKKHRESTLDANIAAARAAGISYGLYMARKRERGIKHEI